ncbi:hypothetical protein ACET3X_000854 [Alternaria dauci]|uniref:Uncharacterized protein n=1 Tax=Alternaria dauci TaxID=48095 RepID=A0ABR3UVN1_9PLEO
MRLATSVIAGFIAVGAATPAGLTILPTSTNGFPDTVTTQPTPVDGNWHIGCDANNYCSYYQDSHLAAESSADSLSSRTVALSEATCKQCTSQDPCSYCDSSDFSCRDCDHYQCEDGYLSYRAHCFDIQPELAEVIRDGAGTTTISATITETVMSTRIETTSIFLPAPTSESIITITGPIPTNMIFPPRHSVLAARNAVASNEPVRRRAAFKESQCVPCGASTCPECHDDCAECDKFLCNDLAAHLTVCMSVRSKWQPPSFNVSASAPSETTTVVIMPQPETTTTTQTVVVSTLVSTISTPEVSTVTVLPIPSPVVDTVTVSVPTVSTTTVIVAPQIPTAVITTIISVPQVPLIRAAHTPAPMSPREIVLDKITCDTCEDNLDCDGCNFTCGEECFHFICKGLVDDFDFCVSVPGNAGVSEANNTSMTPSDFLGPAAMLLVLDDAEGPESDTSASRLQPSVSNGTRPDFAFAEEDCYVCEVGDESCAMCDWQFTCGTKKRCFHNGAREVVEMCFETGEKCHP